MDVREHGRKVMKCERCMVPRECRAEMRMFGALTHRNSPMRSIGV